MFWTNRHKVNVVAEHRRIGDGHGLLDARGRPAASLATLRSPATSPEEGGLAEEAALKSNEGYSSEGGSGLEGEGGDSSASTVDEHGGATAFTAQGAFCLVRLLAASAFCALDSLHGLPVYLCVLLIGMGALALDVAGDLHRGVTLILILTLTLTLNLTLTLTLTLTSQPTILLPDRLTRSSSLLAPSELGSAVSLLFCLGLGLGLGLGFELEPNPQPSPLALTLSAHPKRSP